MAKWQDITKEEFDAAYNQHLPKRWIKFAYKYFSQSTEQKDIKPGRAVAWILGSLFLVGFFATVLKLPRVIIAWATISYMVLLTILVGFLFAAVFANNARLKKVMKILGVSKTEYNLLADRFYD